LKKKNIFEVGNMLSDIPRDPDKSIRAFENLKKLLSPGGQIVLVVGLGLNTQFEMSFKKQNNRI
jgi:hypothetical protein